MKPSLLLASCLTLAVTHAAMADDGLANKPAAQPVATVGSKPRGPGVGASPGRTAFQPGVNGPHHRAPVATQGQNQLTNYQTKQIPDQSRRHDKTSAAGATVQAANNSRLTYADALRRYRHERHDRDWWRRHFTTVVFVTGGFYYWDAGYWFPAWGYSPAYDNYDYDGPIYTYGNLLPDQVIVNVQSALQEEGYYSGPITGSLSPATRQAIANYQRDYGLAVTAAVDEPTIEALGLN
jgi:hypothetical protein